MSKIFVDQVDPKTATTLTLGTSGDTVTVPTGVGLTATDEVKTNKISPATGTAFTLGDSGDTFTVPSGATIVNSGTATGFGGNNTPSFRVILSGNQSIANSTLTKITFDTETWDTDSDFASNKFTVSEAGKYLIVLGGRISGFTDAEEFQLRFKKNGFDLEFGQAKIVSAGTNPLFLAQQATIIESLSASDYIEGYTYQNTGSAADLVSSHTYMAGYKLNGV